MQVRQARYALEDKLSHVLRIVAAPPLLVLLKDLRQVSKSLRCTVNCFKGKFFLWLRHNIDTPESNLKETGRTRNYNHRI